VPAARLIVVAGDRRPSSARPRRARSGPITVPSGWEALRMATPRSAWRAGLNRVDLLFAGAVPVDAGVGDVDYLLIQVREDAARAAAH
jgi:hypothetical protein